MTEYDVGVAEIQPRRHLAHRAQARATQLAA